MGHYERMEAKLRLITNCDQENNIICHMTWFVSILNEIRNNKIALSLNVFRPIFVLFECHKRVRFVFSCK